MRRHGPPGGLRFLSDAAAAGAGLEALLAATPRLAPGVTARRIESGRHPLWVFRNPATDRYFRASPQLYLLAARLDGRISVAAALDDLAETPDAPRNALLDGLKGMMAAGLLLIPRGRTPARRPNQALAAVGGLVFTRFRLGDLSPAMPLLRPLLGWIYTRGGMALLGLLIAAAVVAWAGRGPEIAAHAARYADLGFSDVVWGYLLFVGAKALHECGHAVAADRMARAEGNSAGTHPWGVSFMFLMPAPFVDASSAWFLESRWRRAAVGLAGVATDLMIAAIAALLWAEAGPGPARDRLFDLVVICGVSSLLFNLNPLARLDGYYVLSDLLGIPNLMARAQAARTRLIFGSFGLAPAPVRGDWPLGTYAVASWVYRWTIYLSIFWLAGGHHWLLAGGVAGVVALLFLGLPLVRAGRTAPAIIRRSPLRAAAFGAVTAGIIAGIVLLPLPQYVIAEGIVVRPDVALVFARTDGRVVEVASAGARRDDTPVLRLDNPETERLIIQLRAEAASLAIDARRARAAGAERVDAVAERQRAVASQIAALESERATWTLTPPPGATWEPLRADMLRGAWVRRDDNRPLGALLVDGPVEVHLVLDQWDGPAALNAIAGDSGAGMPLRLRGDTAVATTGLPVWPVLEAQDGLPSAALATAADGRIPARLDDRGNARPTERVFELRVLVPDRTATQDWLHGARVEARIALPDASLLDQAWHRLRQALQRRLAV